MPFLFTESPIPWSPPFNFLRISAFPLGSFFRFLLLRDSASVENEHRHLGIHLRVSNCVSALSDVANTPPRRTNVYLKLRSSLYLADRGTALCITYSYLKSFNNEVRLLTSVPICTLWFWWRSSCKVLIRRFSVVFVWQRHLLSLIFSWFEVDLRYSYWRNVCKINMWINLWIFRRIYRLSHW